MSGTVHLERDGALAILVIDNPPVNAGSHDVRTALLDAVGKVEANPSIEAAVLIGAGRSFISGSDIREFDLPLSSPQLPAVIAAIEGSAKPFVAALHGAALGGGYELALGCDARIAAQGTMIGLPETTLGIIPGAGGTQKLPRLVGPAKAIGLIATGRRVATEQALALGLIDAIAAGDLRGEAGRLALSLVGEKRRVIERQVPADPEEVVEAAAAKALASGRNRPHVAAAIRHVRAAGTVSAAEGLRAERSEFENLRVGAEAKALRHIFFAEREAARGRKDRTATPSKLESVGVVGAGTMGADIATALLQAGLRVVMIEKDEAALERAVGRIDASLEKAVSRGKLDAGGRSATRTNLASGRDLALLSKCELVIEAIIEDIDAKRAVFAALDKVVAPHAVLATNTSYLDIDRIADATERARDVIGLHFFSPAHVMKLLEVIGGRFSSPEAVATGLALARRLNKQPVLAGNGFGFIGNRIYSAYRASCEFMLEDGAFPHEVDAALEHFGFAMGPFAVADLSGLDVAWRMRKQMAHDGKLVGRTVEIPDKLCEEGRFGRKTGAGYYRYGAAGRQRDEAVEEMILRQSAAKSIQRRSMSSEEIQRRAMAAIVNEACLVLDERISEREGDIDVVLVNGYGFPRWKGGPLWWAGAEDPARLREDCEAFVETSGKSRRLADLSNLGSTTI